MGFNSGFKGLNPFRLSKAIIL